MYVYMYSLLGKREYEITVISFCIMSMLLLCFSVEKDPRLHV